ncbi:MAG: hypothetical protein J0L57_01335 [Burkholderiales bacterium]|nr:hypothetical protein [Burkholderiales bacterium]
MAEAHSGWKAWLARELKSLAIVALYFGVWIAAALLLKVMILAEYRIGFADWSVIVVGALILSKVVLILEHVSLGEWLRAQPAWVDVVVRTVLYSAGVVLVLLLERGIEGRSEHGGFGAALQAGLEGVNGFHVVTNAICLSGALFFYNVLSVIRRHLGDRGLLKLFQQPLPPAPEGH